jgi:hypothetical protein
MHISFQHTVQTFTPANVLPLLPYLRRAARALQHTHTITCMRQYTSATLSAIRRWIDGIVFNLYNIVAQQVRVKCDYTSLVSIAYVYTDCTHFTYYMYTLMTGSSIDLRYFIDVTQLSVTQSSVTRQHPFS